MNIANGQFLRDLDCNHRFTMPQILRNDVKKFVIVKSEDGDHLIIFPVQEWEKMAMAKMKKTDSSVSAELRRWFGTALHAKIDKQGRLKLDNYFAEFFTLSKIVVVGVYDHYELWNPEKWQNFIQAQN